MICRKIAHDSKKEEQAARAMATNGKRQENMERRLDHNLTHECE